MARRAFADYATHIQDNPFIRFTPEQFQEYQQQWTQPVEDGDMEGMKQKANAAYWVAYCHRFGTGGVDIDCNEAHRILEQVIQEQNGIDGGNHNDGTGKHRCLLAWSVFDEALSSQLLRQAVPRLELEVEGGGNGASYQEAAYWLGWCLFRGKGVDEDVPRGIDWWKAVAELGHGIAQSNIERYCFRAPRLDVAESISWLLHIADQNNNPWAQCLLGWCHKEGRGVEKDSIRAVEWYDKAIAQGYDRATTDKRDLLQQLSPKERNKTLGCVARNQNIEKANSLLVDGVPLGLWALTFASFQRQENPPWEAPSPTFHALSDGVMAQLQKLLSN